MKHSPVYRNVIAVFCFFIFSNFAYAGGFDYPIEESSYVPGSYGGRSFYYNEEHIGEDVYVPEGMNKTDNLRFVWAVKGGN